jgi:hypothetical protein
MLFATEKRGYRLTLEQDLLGDFVLLHHWYCLHNHLHGGKAQIFGDAETARKQFRQVVRERLRGCYLILQSTTAEGEYFGLEFQRPSE